MSDAPTSLTQTARREAGADGAGDWARPLLDRQLQILGRLAEGGLRIAEAIERQATGQPVEAGSDAPPVVRGDVAAAYARVAQAVRLTLMLQARVIQDIRAPKTAAALGDGIEADDMGPDPSERRRDHILRIVDRVARAQHEDGDTIERLAREAAERLDRDDILPALLSRTVGETIADLCRDLGLDPDWPRLAEEAWAREVFGGGGFASSPAAAASPRFQVYWQSPSGEPVRTAPGYPPRPDRPERR